MCYYVKALDITIAIIGSCDLSSSIQQLLVCLCVFCKLRETIFGGCGHSIFTFTIMV